MLVARSRSILIQSLTGTPWSILWSNCTILCSLSISASISIVIARALGPQIFGSYLFAQWLATVTVPVIGTGMSTLVSRQLAEIQSHESPRLIAGVFYFLWYRQHRSILLYCLTYVLLVPPGPFLSSLYIRTAVAGRPLDTSSIAKWRRWHHSAQHPPC